MRQNSKPLFSVLISHAAGWTKVYARVGTRVNRKTRNNLLLKNANDRVSSFQATPHSSRSHTTTNTSLLSLVMSWNDKAHLISWPSHYCLISRAIHSTTSQATVHGRRLKIGNQLHARLSNKGCGGERRPLDDSGSDVGIDQ
jgi:hypothetical protein